MDEEEAVRDFQSKVRKAGQTKLVVHALASTAPECNFLIGAKTGATSRITPSRPSPDTRRDRSPGELGGQIISSAWCTVLFRVLVGMI